MYVNVYVPKSGGSVVPKSDVYKCSDPSGEIKLHLNLDTDLIILFLTLNLDHRGSHVDDRRRENEVRPRPHKL